MLTSTMTTKAGPSIEIEVPGRTAKADRQAMYSAILQQRFTLLVIAKAPLVRVTVTMIGPEDLSGRDVQLGIRALRSEIPELIEIGPERLEWRYKRQNARHPSAKVRIEARELVIVRQEVGKC